MDYAVQLDLQGGSRLGDVAHRVLSELGELRGGPGEEEMARLATALEPLLALLLEQTQGSPTPATLACALEGDATRIALDLRLVDGDGAFQASLLDPLLPALRQAFDTVEMPPSPAGASFQLILTRNPGG